MIALKETIENAWDNRDLLKNEDTQAAIRKVIDLLDVQGRKVVNIEQNQLLMVGK